MRARLPHVPALDGLRGAAVLGVVAYHAGHLRGGFLGVDLFFVLSGFLITSLLLVEHESTGHIALGAFWGRRFRRLLPAVLVVLAAVALYGALELPASALGDLRRDGLGTLAYVANWVSISAGSDYWSAFASPSLLEHAWSLAIEEQFYVVWPLLAAFGLRSTHGRRGPLIAATAVMALVSVLALWWHHDPGGDTSRAYYGTDSRAAAILYGALVALALTGRARRRDDPVERVLALGAIPAAIVLAILWSTTSGTSDGLYGWGLPVAGLSAAVVIAGVSGPGARGLLGRTLSLPALRWLGTISYGLYLWHWPVFVVLDAEATGLDGWALTGVRVAVSVALAVVSLHLVEQPVRRGRLPRPAWRLGAPLAGTAVAVALIAATSGAVGEAGDVGDHVAVPIDPELSAAQDQLLLLGDSQALRLGLGAPPEVAGMAVGADATLGCGIGPGLAAVGGQPVAPGAEDARCAGVVDEWLALVEREEPEVVMLHTGAWDILDRDVGGRLVAFGTAEWDRLTRSHLTSVLTRLDATGAEVVVLTAPCFVPAGDGGGPAERGEAPRVLRWNELLRAAARDAGAAVVEYGELLCDGGEDLAEIDGVRMRSDGVHLTDAGAAVAWRWLSEELERLLPDR